MSSDHRWFGRTPLVLAVVEVTVVVVPHAAGRVSALYMGVFI